MTQPVHIICLDAQSLLVSNKGKTQGCVLRGGKQSRTWKRELGSANEQLEDYEL